MSAFAALDAAERAGVKITVDGDRLLLEAETAPPADFLNLLGEHKAEIILLLITSWTSEEWQAFYDERAAIREYDGHASRGEAEVGAMTEVLDHCLAPLLRPSPPAT